jgi:hypothetical protein
MLHAAIRDQKNEIAPPQKMKIVPKAGRLAYPLNMLNTSSSRGTPDMRKGVAVWHMAAKLLMD